MKTKLNALRYFSSSVIIVLVCIVLAFAVFVWRTLSQPLRLETPQTYQVPQALTLSAFLQDLSLRGMIKSPRSILFASHIAGYHQVIKTGVYRLKPGMSISELLEVVTHNKVQYFKVLLESGWTFKTVKARLMDNPHLTQDISALSNHQLMTSLSGNQRITQSLEGMFLPQTYDVTQGATALSVLKEAYQAMQKTLHSAWQHRDKRSPLKSPYQALILASLVEEEAKKPAEKPLIAAVFINRLKRHMRLQSDPTVLYGLGIPYGQVLTTKDLHKPSVFNTYLHKGLPPHPIGLPDKASILAVLHPAENGYYYFVANGRGGHVFSRTYEGQLAQERLLRSGG